MALSAVVTASSRHHHHHHHDCTIKSTTNPDATTSWYQVSSGSATATRYEGCQYPSCGIRTHGYSAAINLRSFGAWESAGGACGLCFKITPVSNPYPSDSSPLGNPIVVRITDLCPFKTDLSSKNPAWCNQTTAEPLNSFGSAVHFDLCEDDSSGAAQAFFDDEYRLSHNLAIRGAMTITYEQVVCDDNWVGYFEKQLWNGACMNPENATSWPESEDALT
ncbi:RlpA-like double-psi beta-barrel-protein domain-containing protein-containing protein [Russula dissimulans]|nr:RlpA-like double-psi beta-barrel-protein domain-containing protein-containing protein [Russula dissimulans]